MDSFKNKKSDALKSDVKISQDVLMSANAVNEINAFFALDPDNLGDNPLLPAVMSQMQAVGEGGLWSTRQVTNDVYDMDAYVSELENSGESLKYTILGVAGYGVVSMYFTYYNVDEHMAIFEQLNYRNVAQEYNEETGELEFDPSIIGLFACKESFDEMIESIVRNGKWPKGKILVIAESHKDDIERCGWLTRSSSGKSRIEWISAMSEGDEMPQTAMAIAYGELEKLLAK